MTKNVRCHNRREVLGLTGGAGFAAVAGCVGPFGGSDSDAEFEVEILDANDPVSSGSVLEVTTEVENVGSDGARDTITLEIDDLQPTTDVFLEPGESTEVTLDVRITSEEGREFETTVESAMDTDSRDVVVSHPDDLTLDITSVTEEVVDGETMEVEVAVTNEGRFTATDTISLDTDSQVDVPVSTDVTVEPGETETVLLEWQTQNALGTEEIAVTMGENSQQSDVRVLRPGTPTVALEETNAPVMEGEPLEVTAVVGNTGEVVLTETLALFQDGVEIASEEVTVGSGLVRQVTIEGVPDTPVGDHQLEVAYGTDAVPVGYTIRPPVRIAESTVRETPEAGGELIDVTLENDGDEAMTVRLDGVIEVAGQPIQFEPPRAISDPALLTYELPPGVHEGARTATVEPGEVVETEIKVPTEPWPFDVGYLPDGELLQIEYDHDVMLSEATEEITLEPHEQVIISEIEIAEIAIRDTLIAYAENIGDDAVTANVVGVLEDAGGGMDDNITDRVEVSLEPGEREAIEFTDIGAVLDIPGLPFVEVDGTRDNAGQNTGLLVDVEELEA